MRMNAVRDVCAHACGHSLAACAMWRMRPSNGRRLLLQCESTRRTTRRASLASHGSRSIHTLTQDFMSIEICELCAVLRLCSKKTTSCSRSVPMVLPSTLASDSLFRIMHIKLAFYMRLRNRLAAKVIQRAWRACRAPLRQAVVFGPQSYRLTRMVHALGGFYQTHSSEHTTHVLIEDAEPEYHGDAVRVRDVPWLRRLYHAHASPEQRGLGRSPACNAHDGPVNLPLIARCDLKVESEVVEGGRRRRQTVLTSHFGCGYKRTRLSAPVEDTVVGTCTYTVRPAGTFVGPLVDRIVALVLRTFRRVRRVYLWRVAGPNTHRRASLLQFFLLRRLRGTRACGAAARRRPRCGSRASTVSCTGGWRRRCAWPPPASATCSSTRTTRRPRVPALPLGSEHRRHLRAVRCDVHQAARLRRVRRDRRRAEAAVSRVRLHSRRQCGRAASLRLGLVTTETRYAAAHSAATTKAIDSVSRGSTTSSRGTGAGANSSMGCIMRRLLRLLYL